MDFRTALRKSSPSAYRAAVHIRKGSAAQRILRVRSRARSRRIFEAGKPVTVDVSVSTGLGGILTHAGRALYVAQKYGVDMALRFTSPNYAPSWGEVDWLETYFVRHGSPPGDALIVHSQDVPFLEHPPELRDTAALVWSTIGIRDDIVAHANTFVEKERFAAVHFRGSDKFLEVPRVTTEAVLETVERDMDADKLERLFVATDEPAFLAQAQQRFGSAMFSIPLEAVSTEDGRPAHFTDVDGETKALEALTTMIILSQSQLLVKTESLLSDWATTLTSNQRVVLVRRP